VHVIKILCCASLVIRWSAMSMKQTGSAPPASDRLWPTVALARHVTPDPFGESCRSIVWRNRLKSTYCCQSGGVR